MKLGFTQMAWASKWKKPPHRTHPCSGFLFLKWIGLNAFFLKPPEHDQSDDRKNYRNHPVINAQHFWQTNLAKVSPL